MTRSPVRHLRWIALWLVLGSVLLGRGLPPAVAQDEAGVVRSTAEYVYGQTMRFHLDAVDIGEVRAITLFFRLGASPDSYSVPIDVPPGREIEVSYALDLTQTRLPPFSAITYWWEIERAEDTLLVPEQVISYVDDQFNWSQMIETDEQGGGSIRIHWTGEGTTLGEAARDITFDMLPEIGRLLPLEQILPFDIYLYPSTGDIGAALRLAGRDFQPGQTYPDLGVVLATVVNPETAETELRGELSRGLTDLLLYQALGQFAYSVPPWLSRGIGGVVRGTPDVTLDNALRAALSAETAIPVAELCAATILDSDLALAQSEALVAYVAANYGDAAVRDLVTAFAGGADCPTALRDVVNLSPEQLETAWLRSLSTGQGGRSLAEIAVWGVLLLAGFGLAALLLLRPRR